MNLHSALIQDLAQDITTGYPVSIRRAMLLAQARGLRAWVVTQRLLLEEVEEDAARLEQLTTAQVSPGPLIPTSQSPPTGSGQRSPAT